MGIMWSLSIVSTFLCLAENGSLEFTSIILDITRYVNDFENVNFVKERHYKNVNFEKNETVKM